MEVENRIETFGGQVDELPDELKDRRVNGNHANGNGVISQDEFRRMIQSRGFYVSDKEATEMVEKMDKNKDGRVTFSEVSNFFKRQFYSCTRFCDDIQISISYPCLSDTMLINFLSLPI